MLRMSFIFLLLLVSVSPIFASTDAIETARENCNQVESPLDVSASCEYHINCIFNSATINCTEYTLVYLITTCSNLNASTCVDVATLTMIAIDDAVLNYQTIDSTTQLNKSLKAYLALDYQTAIDFYENVTLALDYFPYYNLELGLGVLYLRFNNPDVARVKFDKSLNLEFYNPLAFYFRGNTYLQLDNSVRALRDHYMYDLLADPQVKSRLPLRAFTIQIPNSEFWNHYPVYTFVQDNGDFVIQDNTRVSANPIVVSFVDDDETLVIADWLDIVAGAETEILFLERDPENPLRYIMKIDQQDVPNSVVSGETEISVVVSPTHLDLYLRSTQGDTHIQVASLARENDAPDTRLDSPLYICETAPLSFGELGTEIVILPSDQMMLLYETPDINSETSELIIDTTAKPFTVIDGYVCDDTKIWWQISNGTQSGWIIEHDRLMLGQFLLFPKNWYDIWAESAPTPLQYLDTQIIPD